MKAGETREVAASGLVRKLWQYCNVLRDDGLSYPDYVEQLTYLLFLKMSDELPDGPIRKSVGWNSFAHLDAEDMHWRYEEVLHGLGKSTGMVGQVFRNARNKIRDPAKLRLLVVDLIGQTEWVGISDDLKGDAYEGLLEKNARDTKSGAGQYFTPRSLVRAIVDCIDPRPGEVVCDPACGTGGFLLAAYDHMTRENPSMSAEQKAHLRTYGLRGVELVEEVARLATMNFLLHGISSPGDDELPITCADSLAVPPTRKVDVVLTNPPFGVKGSVTYTGVDGKSRRSTEQQPVPRTDFWVTTANKQLNFLQHIAGLLEKGGRSAVVLPDNVLFEGGAAAVIRRKLLESFDVHTLLRLPRGLFYAHGIEANVLFFDRPGDRREISPNLWVYDFRTGNHYSLKARPLAYGDLEEFVRLYKQPRTDAPVLSRWNFFGKQKILATPDAGLDLGRTGPGSPDHAVAPSLDELARQIRDDLQAAMSHVAEAAGIELAVLPVLTFD